LASHGGENVTEFKVGDKVEHNGRRNGVLTYGPFQSVSLSGEAFLLKEEDGRERVVRAGYLTALPSFAVGDEAVYDGYRVKIEGGPVTGFLSGDEVYLFRFLEGPNEGKGASRPVNVFQVVPTSEPIKVGDVVRVLKDRAEFADVKAGDTFTVAEMMSGGRIAVHAPLRVGGRFWYFEPESLEKVTDDPAAFTYRGIAYEYGAEYRDREGDIFEFKAELSAPGTLDQNSDGTPIGRSRSDSPGSTPGRWVWSLAEAVNNYGPLRKV
jgi:hypothetical protein